MESMTKCELCGTRLADDDEFGPHCPNCGWEPGMPAEDVE